MSSSRLLKIMWAMILILVASPALADVPQMVNYQGRLSDSGGQPIDTIVEMTFSICLDSMGIYSIWSETHDSVNITNGLFNVRLGTDSALSDNIFPGNNLWLRIKVGDIEGQIIEPPTEILSSPYAFHTKSADSADRALSAVRSDTTSFSEAVETIDSAIGGIIYGDMTIQGNLEVVGKINIPADTQYYVLAAGDWVPKNNSVIYETDISGMLLGSSSLDEVTFYATLHLPEGATITSFRAYIFDNSTEEDISITLFYHSGTARTDLSTLESSGASPTFYNVEDNLLSHTVTSSGGIRSYQVVATWAAPPGEMTLGNVRIGYIISSLNP